jgi:hypothetical protein
MGRKSKTRELIDSNLGQHLALSVAAHLARTQLLPDPLGVYGAQHASQMLDSVANALVRVAPLYVQDTKLSQPRQLMEAELDGARIGRGATVLMLKDGRALSAVSIKRTDLRQAIAVLKAIGIQELAPPPQPEPPKQPARDRVAELRTYMAEVERLLRQPLVPSQAARANALLVAVARDAPEGRIANLAMRLMSAVHEARELEEAQSQQIPVMVARLRGALEEANT